MNPTENISTFNLGSLKKNEKCHKEGVGGLLEKKGGYEGVMNVFFKGFP